MIRSLFFLMTAFAVSAAHAKFTVDSVYPSGTDKTKAFEKCTVIEEFEAGAQLSCPVMPEAAQAGYSIGYIGWDHGAMFTMEYQGQEIDFSMTEIHNTFYNFKLSEKWEPSWFDTGVAYGVFEFRFKQEGNKKTPFAIIYRDNYTTSAIHSDTYDWDTSSVASALIVIKLDGANTKVIGVVDSVKAYNQGKNANVMARECADSIVGLGNAASCTNQ